MSTSSPGNGWRASCAKFGHCRAAGEPSQADENRVARKQCSLFVVHTVVCCATWEPNLQLHHDPLYSDHVDFSQHQFASTTTVDSNDRY